MPRFSRSTILILFALAASSVPFSICAEEATTPERVEVGQTAPDFTLPDPDGVEHSASALRGEKNLLLVFFRGTW